MLAELIDHSAFALALAAMLNFQALVGPYARRALETVQVWVLIAGIYADAAIQAAMKTLLGVFMATITVITLIGALSTRFAGVQIPEWWMMTVISTTLAILTVATFIIAYLWDNRPLTMSQIESIRARFAALPVGNNVARDHLRARIQNEIRTQNGDHRVSLTFVYFFIAGSFMLLGGEFIAIALELRRAFAVDWAGNVATAIVGVLTVGLGASSLGAPLQVAALIAKELDLPLEGIVSFLRREGLILLPGITSKNVDAGKGDAVPFDRIAAYLRYKLVAGMDSSWRYLAAVVILATDWRWAFVAGLIGFFGGMALAEKAERAFEDTLPDIRSATKLFWGRFGVFMVAVIIRAVVFLCTTPEHANNAPGGSGTTVVQDVTTVGQRITIPTTSPGLFSAWWHHLAAMSFDQKFLGVPAAFIVAGIGLFLTWGVLDSLSSDKVTIPGKIAWGTLGTIIGLAALIGGSLAFGAQVFA